MLPIPAKSFARVSAVATTLSVLILVAFASTSCSYYLDKTPAKASRREKAREQGTEISYEIVREKVLGPRCTSCHGDSGGLNLESYDAVTAQLDAIKQAALISKTMPKGSALSNEEALLLSQWIEAGAPKDPIRIGDGTQPATTPTPAPTPPPITIGPAILTFEFVNQSVLAPRCASCHGAGSPLDLTTYANVRAKLADVMRVALVEKTMPKDKPLSTTEYEILLQWIGQGAPETPGGTPVPGAPDNGSGGGDGGGNGSPTDDPNGDPKKGPVDGPEGKNPPPDATPDPDPDATPTPTPDPGDQPDEGDGVTFADIRTKVFVPRCLRCHSTDGSASTIPLSSKEDLLSSNISLVVPGKPDESLLVEAIERTGAGRMPPPSTGPALDPDQIKLIRDWIAAGARD